MAEDYAGWSASIALLIGITMMVIGVALIHGSRHVPPRVDRTADEWYDTYDQDVSAKEYPRGIHG